MHRRLAILLLLALAASTDVCLASQKYSGRWERTSMRLNVTVESWGEDCGPRPKSYSSSKVIPVDVAAQGKHLVFSKGGLRTDRCPSPNPRIRSVSDSASPGKWKRVCQTSKDDPKFEKGEYTLTAYGDDKLVYEAKSRFDWTLKGDHCVAILSEKRIYVRESTGAGPSPEPSPAPAPVPSIEEPEKPPTSDCEDHGPMKRLVVQPRETTIGPGERVCLTAYGIDESGCRFQVGASWTARQDGQEVGGLLSRSGCFTAGETAAESEGLYTITARAETKQATADVVVSFPDLGDLLAARLRPAAEDDEETAEKPEKTPEASGSGPTDAGGGDATSAGASGGSSSLLLISIVSAGVVLAAALLVVALVLRRRSTSRVGEEDDAWLDDPIESRMPTPLETPPDSSRVGPERSPAAAIPSAREVICPKCGSAFPEGAKFCPHDGAPLAPEPEGGGAPPRGAGGDGGGMVCPKCHRGYDAGARFCPHDSEPLVPYREWRSKQR